MTQDALRGRRLLVVEDEAMICMLLEDMLEDLGCILVGTAGNIAQALSAVESKQFDAAVLDLNLNGQQTTFVAEALRAKDIPFIYATGYGSPALRAEFESQTVLTKPFTQSQLESALRGLLL